MTDASVAAGDISTIKGVNTNGTIAFHNDVATVTGTAAAVITAYGQVNTGKGNEAININDGTASVAQARSLNGLTDGNVTATITGTETISAILNTDTGINESGGSNAYAITIALSLIHI